jgi:drug/metabolite transporter (DMT)-like permease
MDRERALGVILIVISACGYGSGALFAQPIYAAGVDWMTLLAWRFLFAALLSWGWLLLFASQRRALRGLSRRRVLILVLLGIFFIGNSGTYFAALETVSASLAALIVYAYPAIVAVLSIRFARRLEGRRRWFALALSLAGVALAIGGIDPSDAPPPLGLALIVASPIIYAVWIIMAEWLGRDDRTPFDPDAHASAPPYDSEVAVEDSRDAAPTAAIMLSATAVAWWVGALATNRPVMPWQIPSDVWWALFGVGLVARRSTPASGASVPPRHRWSARSSRSTRSPWPRFSSARRSRPSSSWVARWSSLAC